VCKYAKKLKPSRRGELEITDLLNIYKKEKKLNFEHIGRGAIWSDAGKIDDMTNISTFVQSVENVENIKIACLEEIALSKKWINKKTILKNIKFYGNCEYSNYLKKL
jgi:glucose-1-phosphate thymidylyltransferase